MQLVISILLITLLALHGLCFTKIPGDYDLYGIKIAGNNQIFVSADNFVAAWFIHLKVLNTRVSCTFSYATTACDFVYSIIVPKVNGTSVIYNCVDTNEKNVIGVFTVNNSCYSQLNNEKVMSNYSTQDNLVIAANADNTGVYGFADDFVFFYALEYPFHMNVWPNTFNISPRAIDIALNVSYGVVVGYRQLLPSVAVEYGLIIQLNRNLSSPVIYNEIPITNTLNFSWSDPRATHLITQSRAYSSLTTLSVSMSWLTKNILIGVPSLNLVMLYAFDNISQPISMRQNGIGFNGYGKSVAWLDSQGKKAVILVNSYVFSTSQWVSSSVHVYDIESDGFSDNTLPIFIYPNSKQKPFKDLNEVFIRLDCSIWGHLLILDNLGNLGIILSAPAGSYPDTTLRPISSLSVPCISGTYRYYAGIELCTPCPPGTFSSSCQQCDTNKSFCPRGSIADLPYSTFESIEQEQDYPESSESTIFDDVLLQNIFKLDWSSRKCALVSPLTWVFIFDTIGIMIALILVISEIRHTHLHETHHRIKEVLKKIDLIGEGELWIGGLVSVGIIVLVTATCVFSSNYHHRYPIENVAEDSPFACNSKLYNAKFKTTLQKLPQYYSLDKPIKPMLELLNSQPFYLNIDLIQTAFTCQDSLTVQHLVGYTMVPMSIMKCAKAHNSSILSLTVALPTQAISIQLVLPGLLTIGAIRVGLSGPSASAQDGRYKLLELNFASKFTPSMLNQTLAPSSLFLLQLTPIINTTAALSHDGLSTYSAIWSSSYNVEESELFYADSRYLYYKRVQTSVNVTIEKTVFYVSNEQEPIARQTEIIFRVFLFVIVILEVFGLIFLIFKLVILPLIRMIIMPSKKYIAKKTANIPINHNL